MQQNRSITILLLIALVGGGIFCGQWIASSPDVVAAILISSVVMLASLAVVIREREDHQFVVRLWLCALGLRVLVGTAIYYFDLRDRIAPDWSTYDFFGDALSQYWHGATGTDAAWLLDPTAKYRSGWGMYYFVAAIYYLIGQNPLATQLICCVMGANSCVLIYYIARIVYPRQRVARLAGVMMAVAPSMLIWTSQGLKEPLIIFLLCISLLLTLRLSHRITIVNCALLLISFLCLYSLRHYVFYVIFVAAAGTILFTVRAFSPARIMQGSLAILLIGLIFAYFGAGDVAQKSLDLEKLQASREWSAKVSESGYGGDVDITDTRQALVYLPLGTLFFLFAPFPWMIKNLNHLITLPELVLWWLATPLLFRGFWFAFWQRLRASLAICLFTIGLTLAYGLYLTNFGTAHRMRVQVLGFFVIFVSIGWELGRVARERRRIAYSHSRLNWSPSISAVTK